MGQVFILTEEGRLSIRAVDIIYATPDQTLVSSGVIDGEQVIVSAIRNPIAGMRLEAIDTNKRAQEGGGINALAD